MDILIKIVCVIKNREIVELSIFMVFFVVVVENDEFQRKPHHTFYDDMISASFLFLIVLNHQEVWLERLIKYFSNKV